MLANYRMALVARHFVRQNLKPNIILANTLSNYLLSADADARSIEGQELIRAKALSSRPLKLIIGNPLVINVENRPLLTTHGSRKNKKIRST